MVLLTHGTLCILNLKDGEDPLSLEARQIFNHIKINLRDLTVVLYVLSVRKSDIVLKRTKLWRKNDCRSQSLQ